MRHGVCTPASAARTFSAVTGSSRKRRPVACAMAFTIAGTTAIITTSAMPLCGSLADSAGSTSPVCFHTATSLARGSV